MGYIICHFNKYDKLAQNDKLPACNLTSQIDFQAL